MPLQTNKGFEAVLKPRRLAKYHLLRGLVLIPKSRRFPKYNPLHGGVREWIQEVKELFDRIKVPDAERPQNATWFIKKAFGVELEEVVRGAQTKFGAIPWAQFTEFMVEFDRKFQEMLSFYKEHRKPTGAALGIAGCIVIAPCANHALTAAGFTRTGVAADQLTTIIQSIVTGRIYSLLQPPDQRAATTVTNDDDSTTTSEPDEDSSPSPYGRDPLIDLMVKTVLPRSGSAAAAYRIISSLQSRN